MINLLKKTWAKLQTWIYTNDIKSYKQMALHHDNPIITPLEDCQYIAIAVLDEKEELKDLSLPTLDIPKGIYAKFSLSGKYGDVIKLIQWVYHVWLIDSGYETTTNPSYTIYEKNHFLSLDGEFILDFYLPIKYVYKGIKLKTSIEYIANFKTSLDPYNGITILSEDLPKDILEFEQNLKDLIQNVKDNKNLIWIYIDIKKIRFYSNCYKVWFYFSLLQ